MEKKLLSTLLRLTSKGDTRALMARLDTLAPEALPEAHATLFRAACESQSGASAEALWERMAPQARGPALLAEDEMGASALSYLACWAPAPWAPRATQALSAEQIARPDSRGWTGALCAAREANWEFLGALISASPQCAQALSPHGQGLVDFLSRPSFAHRSGQAAFSWAPPPKALIERALDLGAPLPKPASDRAGALTQAIEAPEMISLLLDRIAQMPAPERAPYFERGKLEFTPLALALLNQDEPLAERLMELGAPTRELTYPLRQSLSQLSLGRMPLAFCAKALTLDGIGPGAARPIDWNPESLPSLLRACLADEAHALDKIQLLAQRELDPFARAHDGANLLDYAMERSSLALLEALWDRAPIEARLRHTSSPLGLLERAARSKIQTREKLDWALAHGFTPASIQTAAWESFEPLVARHTMPDGTRRAQTLNRLWATEPTPGEPLSSVMPDGAGERLTGRAAFEDSEDDFDHKLGGYGGGFGSAMVKIKPIEPRKPVERQRPSFFGYCVGRELGVAASWFLEQRELGRARLTEPDARCAWLETLERPVALSFQNLAKAQLQTLGVSAWDARARDAAFERVTPARGKKLGMPEWSASAWLDSPEALAMKPNLLFWRDGPIGYESAPASAPWERSAKLAPRDALERLCMGPQNRARATLAAQALRRCCEEGVSDAQWVKAQALITPIARLCEPDSPWGREPERAIALWEEQISHEARAHHAIASAADSGPAWAKKNKASAPDLRTPYEGGFGTRLLATLSDYKTSQLSLLPFLSLAREGLPPGEDLERPLRSFSDRLGMARGQRQSAADRDAYLQSARELMEFFVQTPAWRAAALATDPSFLISRLFDPHCFDLAEPLLREMRDSLGEVPSGAHAEALELFNKGFNMLSAQSGRQSAHFAQRCVMLAGELANPSAPAEMILTMAEQRQRGASGAPELSRAAIERAARALSHWKPKDWEAFSALEMCPISAAFKAGNASIALRWAAMAPPEHKARFANEWLSHWMRGRSILLTEAARCLEPATSAELGAPRPPAAPTETGDMMVVNAVSDDFPDFDPPARERAASGAIEGLSARPHARESILALDRESALELLAQRKGDQPGIAHEVYLRERSELLWALCAQEAKALSALGAGPGVDPERDAVALAQACCEQRSYGVNHHAAPICMVGLSLGLYPNALVPVEAIRGNDWAQRHPGAKITPITLAMGAVNGLEALTTWLAKGLTETLIYGDLDEHRQSRARELLPPGEHSALERWEISQSLGAKAGAPAPGKKRL